MPEIYNALARGVTATLGASAAFRRDRLFAHLDLGVDWNIYSHAPSAAGEALHYDAGAGIDLGSVAIMLESENALLSSDRGSLHAVALSARTELDAVSVYAAIVAPLGGDLSDAVELAVIAGAEFTFP
jgi:hypothetical protein